MRRSFTRPSPAMVLAMIALVVAFGGTSFAALKLKKNSVKTKTIKDNAITSPKIADGAVTGGKIAKGALTGGKFFLGTVVNLNEPLVPGSTCTEFNIPAPGVLPTDSTIVTPPPGWADTFTLVARPAPATADAVTVSICNVFTGGGAGDPDGTGGGPYKLLVIR
jgi:hypothetical protein